MYGVINTLLHKTGITCFMYRDINTVWGFQNCFTQDRNHLISVSMRLVMFFPLKKQNTTTKDLSSGISQTRCCTTITNWQESRMEFISLLVTMAVAHWHLQVKHLCLTLVCKPTLYSRVNVRKRWIRLAAKFQSDHVMPVSLIPSEKHRLSAPVSSCIVVQP